MTNEEFDDLYDQVSRQVVEEFLEKSDKEIRESLHEFADEDGKIDLQSSQIALTTFALNSSMEFSRNLLYAVLQKLFVVDQ